MIGMVEFFDTNPCLRFSKSATALPTCEPTFIRCSVSMEDLGSQLEQFCVVRQKKARLIGHICQNWDMSAMACLISTMARISNRKSASRCGIYASGDTSGLEFTAVVLFGDLEISM